ncbi:K-exchanger-like protein precursor [Zea mays]|jgi:solute carrier family 24 (sodium/potassium/calcium exchanger), member 6|uniref:Sodium/calcium exchanger membrane region domain-containing protein n=1 Tax=Zea mays TaxID=4577 RepID=A0A804LS50_MAIZE|nr:K-exchanger-like protein precursor [Zea mays]|eukprot:NP_001147600.2 K-exchanger-like protein precursor [Zea mays]
MASLRQLHKCRRNAAATAAFLLTLLSVAVARDHRPGVGRSSEAELRAPAPAPAQAGRSCEAQLRALPDHAARCRYLSWASHPACAPRGYVHYLRLFYCAFGGAPWLGAAALALWLLLLFYLLGDTASQYFCAALQGLSAALRLPPAIAGVTLLSLGNGAPDVLSSVVAFAAADADAGDVGLSSVLGGALFVSTVVAGVVAIVASSSGTRGGPVEIERAGFVRDVCFLLVALCYLLAVLLTGSVTVWAAASFLSLYAAYVLLVWTSHCCAEDGTTKPAVDDVAAAGPDPDLAAPLLAEDPDEPPALPISSKHAEAAAPPRRGRSSLARHALHALQWPLYLPRRLTIPDIAAHRWSKRYAVASALLAPLLLAAISSPSSPAAALSGAVAGTVLAAAAARGTSSSSPPAGRCRRLPWLAGGFLMSVLWSYLLARELVALLVSIGLIAGVRASVLGATVLAWGNSLGDLVADVAMAMHGGHGGAQTAVSGCYAGPVFNTVVGLGLSLTLAAGARFPRPYAIPADASAYQAAGFLAAGLVWAIVVLPARGMRLDKVLGVGLLLIYLGFLGVRLGSLSLGGANGS